MIINFIDYYSINYTIYYSIYDSINYTIYYLFCFMAYDDG